MTITYTGAVEQWRRPLAVEDAGQIRYYTLWELARLGIVPDRVIAQAIVSEDPIEYNRLEYSL